MGFLIDTSVLIRLEREGPSENFQPAYDRDRFAISCVTVSELLVGVHLAGPERRTVRSATVERMIDRLKALPVDDHVARVHALLTAQLEESGRRLAGNDSWIAATALAGGLKLITLDKGYFDRVPGLTVLSPDD